MSEAAHERETALIFECEGTPCVGICHAGATGARLGVVIVVGGPQYRVGSHRQFVLLARALAAGGIPVFRFDYRGMGDSDGADRDFTRVEADLRAAIDAFVGATRVERVVLWGLCDAASAILMYLSGDARIAGVALANPWVHTEVAEAQVRLQTYYLKRLRSPELWSKLRRFELAWRDSVLSLVGYLRQVFAPAPRGETANEHFIERMWRGWNRYTGATLLVMSGDDLTADEFRRLCAADPHWRDRLARPDVARCELPAANHTFARAEWRAQVEQATLAWVRRLADDVAPLP